MVSPGLNKRTIEPLNLTLNAKKIFQVIHREQNKEEDPNIAKIKVSALVSKMAFFYEKVRNAVDYDEEHLLRKNAIERILKRQIVIEGVLKPSQSPEIAKHLIIELIRGAYLPNNKIPEAKIKEIADLIEKYIRLKEYSVKQISSLFNFKAEVSKMKDEINERNNTINWLITLAASEIEENLGYSEKEQTVSSGMFEILSKHIELPADLPYEKDLDIQIHLSIFRKHFKFDKDMLYFVLFKYFNSSWSNPSEEDLKSIAKKIKPLQEAMEKQLNHPLRKQLDSIIRKHSLFFQIFSKVVEENPVITYQAIKKSPQDFDRLIKKVCGETYKKLKKKLWKAAFRSIIYIFVTKSIFVVLLEVPAIKFFGEEFDPVTLGIL